MKKLNVIGLVAIVLIFFASCGGGETKQADQKTEVVEETTQGSATDKIASDDMLTLGKKIYDEKCVDCHQLTAEGIPGAFPPLKDADYLQADLKRGVLQTLKGSEEEMLINGILYTAPMPPQVETLEEAIAVINYVLKEFDGYSDDKLVKMADFKDMVIE